MIAKLAHLHYARLLADALSHEEGSRSEAQHTLAASSPTNTRTISTLINRLASVARPRGHRPGLAAREGVMVQTCGTSLHTFESKK